jgi:poly(3-hydroxyalkanoate) synthetase
MTQTAFSSPLALIEQAWEYWIDTTQRSTLFLDVMRERGNISIEHAKNGKPPLLAFESELLIDGRSLAKPCNYMLLRVLPLQGIQSDESKRPYVIIDPRAGHGAGIGGFKADSQVGVALRAGHPVYFVGFYPDPVPGQRLQDVMQAEALFIEEIIQRHPKANGKPCVIGNCQAGWAVAGLAALRPEIMGPIVLNGAPLSYWAGSDEQNPMRYAGGVNGGSWMAALTADLGGGIFDGAHLVKNFENLNPANTLWGKPYHLYANIDTEAPRYLEFERWWGGHFRMTGHEIEAIVNQLFIGNKLASGEIQTPDGDTLDLHKITSPIIVFASWGDDITPPAQALNWIIDLYGHESAIVAEGQIIVYLLHKDIGHLGIFVGSKVARKEHAELVNVMEMVESLPPGLYEMVIETKAADLAYSELEQGDYSVSFETRSIEQLRLVDPETREDEAIFSTVAQVSEINDAIYKNTLRPILQAVITPEMGEWSRKLNIATLKRYAYSDFNPLMASVSLQAEQVRQYRRPIPADNIFLDLEKQASEMITDALNTYRDIRNAASSSYVKAVYGPLGLGAFFPPAAPVEEKVRTEAEQQLETLRDEAEPQFEQGDFTEGLARLFVLAMHHTGNIERRSFLIGDSIKASLPEIDPTAWRQTLEAQTLLISLDAERAIATLPKLLKNLTERKRAVEIVAKVTMLAPELEDPSSPLAIKAKELLGIKASRAKPAAKNS